MKKIITIWLLLAMMPGALASVCTIAGFVNYDDGSPAPKGTIVTVVNLDLGTVYDVNTGGEEWPDQNFFVHSLTCNHGEDRIEITVQDIVERYDYDHYPNWINFTLPAPEEPIEPKEPETEKKPSSGGGSNSGSASYDFGKIMNQTDTNIVPIGTKHVLIHLKDSFYRVAFVYFFQQGFY